MLNNIRRSYTCGDPYPMTIPSNTSTYTRERKGRDDSKTGPNPYPTLYWAYTLRDVLSDPGSGEQDGWTLRYDSPCGGYHWTKDRKEHVVFPPTSIANHGVTPLAAWYNDTSVLAYVPNVPQRLIDLSVSRALGSMNELSLGQHFAEVPKAVSSLADLMKRVLSAMKAIKHGNFIRAAELLGLKSIPDLAGHYLSWIWGFKPFLDGVVNGMDALNNALNTPDAFTLRGLATTNDGPLPGTYPNWTVNGTLLRGASTHLSFKLDDVVAAALNRVGLGSWAGLAWELIPASFIVNWFISIGDFINQLSFGAGLTYSHGHTTTFVRGTLGAESLQTFGTNWRDPYPCVWSLERNLMERKVLPSLPKPTIHMKWSLDSNKLTGLTALALALAK